MKQLDPEIKENHKTIATKLNGTIDNSTLAHLYKFFPDTKSSVCPTCRDRGRYFYNLEEVECDCPFQKLLQKHYFAANIGREYHTLDIQDHFIGEDREKVVPIVEEYIKDFENNYYYGIGITFCGTIGSGKTFAVSFILKELIKLGYSAYFITMDDLINTLGSAWNDGEAKWLNQKLRSVQILGIDELKTDSRNDRGFISQAVESIIRHRTSNLLPTLITTNLSSENEEKIFEKSHSLLSSRNIRVETNGNDIRGKEIRERERGLKELGERRPIH